MAPFHPQSVFGGVTTEWVAWGGTFFIFRDILEVASGGIMIKVNTMPITVLIPLTPRSRGTGANGGGTAVATGRLDGCHLLGSCSKGCNLLD